MLAIRPEYLAGHEKNCSQNTPLDVGGWERQPLLIYFLAQTVCKNCITVLVAVDEPPSMGKL